MREGNGILFRFNRGGRGNEVFIFRFKECVGVGVFGGGKEYREGEIVWKFVFLFCRVYFLFFWRLKMGAEGLVVRLVDVSLEEGVGRFFSNGRLLGCFLFDAFSFLFFYRLFGLRIFRG